MGIFLSSGIDSTALTGLARDAGIQNLITLTLKMDEFENTDNDEAPLAEAIARLYKTKHRTCRLTRAHFLDSLGVFFEAMDQPTVDGANTYFVSEAAKEQGLKVVLSGLGSDELLGGYPSFRNIPRMVSALRGLGGNNFLSRAFRSAMLPLTRLMNLSPKYAGLLEYGGTYEGAYYLQRGLFMPWELTDGNRSGKV